MKEIKYLMGFDHVPDGLGYYNYTDVPVSALPVTFSWAMCSVVTIQGKKYLTGTTANAYTGFNVAAAGIDFSKRIIFAGRFNTSVPSQFRVFSFFNNVGNAASLAEVMGTTLGLIANTDYYIEMEIDVINQKQNFYLDGWSTPVYSRAMTTAQIATILPTYPNLIIGGFSTANIWTARDMYFAHCNGADDIGLLGPIDLSPVGLASDGGTGFSGPAGMANKDALSAAINDQVVGPISPRVEAASVGNSLIVRLAAPALINPIKYVQLFSSSADAAVVSRKLGSKLTQGGVDKALPDVVMKQTWQYGRGLGVMPTAPDGAAWTAAKLNATDLTVTIA